MPLHDRYDPELWRARRDELVREGQWHFSTADPCELLDRRMKLTSGGDLGRSVPTDVFTFIPGEPQERSVTKIGGLPYRPASLPWPRGTLGYGKGSLRSWDEWLSMMGPDPESSREEDREVAE